MQGCSRFASKGLTSSRGGFALNLLVIHEFGFVYHPGMLRCPRGTIAPEFFENGLPSAEERGRHAG